ELVEIDELRLAEGNHHHRLLVLPDEAGEVLPELVQLATQDSLRCAACRGRTYACRPLRVTETPLASFAPTSRPPARRAGARSDAWADPRIRAASTSHDRAPDRERDRRAACERRGLARGRATCPSARARPGAARLHASPDRLARP